MQYVTLALFRNYLCMLFTARAMNRKPIYMMSLA